MYSVISDWILLQTGVERVPVRRMKIEKTEMRTAMLFVTQCPHCHKHHAIMEKVYTDDSAEGTESEDINELIEELKTHIPEEKEEE